MISSIQSKDKNIWYISCTRAGCMQDTILGQSLLSVEHDLPLEKRMCCFQTGNTQPIFKTYNHFITERYRDTYMVFVHDDVSLDPIAISRILPEALERYDIVGLAGCTTAKIAKPALWHLMGPRDKQSGAVAHPIHKDNPEIIHMSSFGPYPQRCIMMDGLFLAVNVGKLLDAGVKFDESNPSISHFYDLDFCLSANKAGLKMSTWPIYVTHRSPGLLSIEDEQWKAGQEWFIKKWA